MIKAKLPERIICLTEESAELLYLIGEQDRIVGVSQFAELPEGIKKEKPVVSVFTHSHYEKIAALNPDLIIGYSDIQKDIARDLVERGHNVWISNHRSLEEVMSYCQTLSHLVGAGDKGAELIMKWNDKISSFKREPFLKVYMEEWDEPRISAIRYFSELVELCGGIDINKHLRDGFKASERFPSEDHILSENPDVILGCWCGKKVDIEAIKERKGWDQLEAVKNNKVFELPPEIFLQPGPALFEAGLDYLKKLFSNC